MSTHHTYSVAPAKHTPFVVVLARLYVEKKPHLEGPNRYRRGFKRNIPCSGNLCYGIPGIIAIAEVIIAMTAKAEFTGTSSITIADDT